ncbi:hypothetical protein BVI1335_70071 [Burkholderia vietnamiensis]|nr:hypothetical protein BVI1335_70071 [Burkholderia vietnamiensis]
MQLTRITQYNHLDVTTYKILRRAANEGPYDRHKSFPSTTHSSCAIIRR